MRCDLGADVSMCRLRTPFSVAAYTVKNYLTLMSYIRLLLISIDIFITTHLTHNNKKALRLNALAVCHHPQNLRHIAHILDTCPSCVTCAICFYVSNVFFPASLFKYPLQDVRKGLTLASLSQTNERKHAMIYAQFFNRNETKIDACGDRAVVIDARLTPESIGQLAARECEKRGYDAWQIWEGESVTRSAPVSQVWYIARGKKDLSAMSATHGY